MLGNRITDAGTGRTSSGQAGSGQAGFDQVDSQRESRWRIVIPVAALLVLLVAGFTWIHVSTSGGSGDTIDLSTLDSGAANSAAPSSSTPTTADPASASADEQGAAAALVSRARADSAGYDEISAATAAGYRPATALSLRSLRSGVRYEVDPADVNGRVDPSHPGGLMYRRTATGDQLVGVLFLGTSSDALADPAGILTTWYPTSLRTRSGTTVEVLPVWFGAGVSHPFAVTWDGATAS
jgi:hypothetical protein